MQNLAPGAPTAPHFGQAAGSSDAPHSLQNFAPTGTAALHFGHGLVCAAGGLVGAWLGCEDGASAPPISAPKFMPTPRPTPAPASPPPPVFAASSSASAALKRVYPSKPPIAATPPA